MSRTLFILVSLVTLLHASPSSALAVARAEKIGINVRSNWTAETQITTDNIAPYISAISQTRTGYVRLFIPWKFIQPEEKKDSPPAEWNWGKIDLMIEHITAHGMEPLIVLSSQPAWATSAVTNAESDTYLPYKNPWNNFVTAMIQRYGYIQSGRQQVKYWEILNEPDAPGREYTSKQYGEFLKYTYPIIKSLDPQAKILNGGLTQISVREDRADWLKQFLSYNHAEFARYFDYFSIHRYGDANTAGNIVTTTKGIFQETGVTKPIWVTETNIGSNFYKPQIICNPEGEETKYLIFKTLFTNILQAGADKVFLLSAECSSWAGPGIIVRDSSSASSPNLVIIQNALTALTRAVTSFITPSSPAPNLADLTDEGDAQGDQVNQHDADQLKADFGKTGAKDWIKADIHKDGKVDVFDYNVLVGAFGT